MDQADFFEFIQIILINDVKHNACYVKQTFEILI